MVICVMTIAAPGRTNYLVKSADDDNYTDRAPNIRRCIRTKRRCCLRSFVHWTSRQPFHTPHSEFPTAGRVELFGNGLIRRKAAPDNLSLAKLADIQRIEHK